MVIVCVHEEIHFNKLDHVKRSHIFNNHLLSEFYTQPFSRPSGMKVTVVCAPKERWHVVRSQCEGQIQGIGEWQLPGGLCGD